MTTKLKIPKIRFKEFSQEWEEKKLGEVSTLTSSKRVYLKDYVEKGIPFYRGKEISELKRNITPNDILYITEQSYNEFKSKYGVPEFNDILITAVGTLGNVLRVKNDDKFYFKDGNLIWLKSIKESSEFIEYLFEYDKNKILNSSIGSSQKALTIVALNKLKFLFPSLPEQQKIASIFSSVDEKIEKIKEKKKSLEEYKKGVMQKIFSQEIRFKDENGDEFGEWKEKKLGEIATFSKGKGLSKDDIIENGKNKCIHYGELFTKYGPKIKNILSNTNLLGNLVFSEGNETLMPTSDVTPNGLATGSAILEKNIILGGDILIIKGEKLYNLFFSYYISSNKQDIMKLVSGSTVYHLYGSDMKNLKINLPTLKEQEKIADFLSGIDDKIEKVSDELEKIEEFKKGLLQGMFV